MFDISKATEEQKLVLLEKDKNILVSAAAGSGKTTVMIEKIVRLMLEQRVSIENFLVLTFTKASAEDMKNKLIERLSCESMSPFVLEQIDNIPVCDVSNLHSFCARLLKSYFYAIGLDPTFAVIDDMEQKKLKTKALDRLFESESKSENSEFFEISDILQNSRKDGKLREQILKIYEFSKSQVDFDSWKQDNLNSVYSADLDQNKCAKIIKNYAKNIVFVFKEQIIELKNRILNNVDEDNSRKKLVEYLDMLDTKLSSLQWHEKFDVFAASVQNVGKYSVIPKVDEMYQDEKNECLSLKAEIKSRIDTISEAIFAEPESTIEGIQEALAIIQKHVNVLYDLTSKFEDIYLSLKKELGVLDFNDLEMFALQVLDNSEVLSEVKQKYKYVFVDEYQDINSVQEKIITLISSDNNRFMVGDIKQSIYGFRLCDPEIFLEKYNSYKSGDERSTSISLNKNFRSYPDILEFVNLVFDASMTKSFGGVDYKSEARLVPGKVVEKKTNTRATLMYIDSSGIENQTNTTFTEHLPVYSVQNHEYLETIETKKAHLEGMVLANKISEIVASNKYLIIDKETKKERQIMFKDIVLLVHSRNDYLNNLLDVLDGAGIPISSDITSDVFEDELILALKNMLFIVSNMSNDKSLFSLMYSGLFGFVPDELMEIRNRSDKKYFYECVLDYKNDGSPLFFKVNKFLETIATYKRLSAFLSVRDLCARIIDEFNIEKQMIASTNSSERLAKLNKFLSSLPNDLLEEFLANNDLSEISCESKTMSNSVRVMTIHKSKGLEFPVVFLIGIGNRFNMKSVYGDLVVSKELGLCMNHFNTTERYKTLSLPRAASKIIENKKFFEEEQRLLYVALTRAIEYLFVSGCAKQSSLSAKFSPTPMSFMEWFAPLLLSKDSENSEIFDIEYYDVSNLESWEKGNQEHPVLISKQDDGIVSELNKRLDFTYAHEKQTITPQKTTITKIAEANGLQESKTEKTRAVSSATRGTAYHKVFEKLSLLERSVHEIEKVVQDLVKAKMLTSDEAGLVDCEKVLQCITSEEFMRDIVGAEWIKRESEFYMLVGDGDRKDQVEVQGIIDLLIKNHDELILYDYKTGYLTQDLASQKYYVQLNGYREAAERIFGIKISKMCIIAIDMGGIFNIT